MATAPTWIYEQRDGVCFGPFAPGVQANYYSLDEVSAVRLHEREVLADERFALAVMVSDDGLSAPVGWRDRRQGFACRPDGDPDAIEVLCVPASAEPATAYLDAQFTTPAVFSSEHGATFGRFVDPDTRCATYHSIGEVIDRARIFLRVGERCDAEDVPPDTIHTLEAAIELAPIVREPIDTAFTRWCRVQGPRPRR
ncbi:MAG: hypothetical protein SFX73_40175 [Kofleriaceae bacterium]|nr:hypothetical protein [Kofleriaceae bacterium]